MLRDNVNAAFHKSYLVINIVLTLIILLIFAYSLVYGVEKPNYPVGSAYTAITGEQSVSTGLSRSFSELIRFRFSSARDYNPYGLQVWLFFVIQLILRVTLTVMIIRRISINFRILVLADVLQAVSLFVVLFWPFIRFFAQQLAL